MKDTVGARVATLRAQRGMSLRQLADGADIAPSTIHRLECDRTRDPGIWTLVAIAHALDVGVATLWMGARPP